MGVPVDDSAVALVGSRETTPQCPTAEYQSGLVTIDPWHMQLGTVCCPKYGSPWKPGLPERKCRECSGNVGGSGGSPVWLVRLPPSAAQVAEVIKQCIMAGVDCSNSS